MEFGSARTVYEPQDKDCDTNKDNDCYEDLTNKVAYATAQTR